MKHLLSSVLILSGVTLALPGLAHDHKEKAQHSNAHSHTHCDQMQHDKMQHGKMDDAAIQAMMKKCAKSQQAEKAKENTKDKGHDGHGDMNKQKHHH